MKRKIVMNIEEDESNGEWGFIPVVSCDLYTDTTFNSFWNGQGIFHDVFEHWFEKDHKYFMGDYGLNVAGEVAAMGACYYYWVDLGVWNRTLNPRNIHSTETLIIETTNSMMNESCVQGYSQYGDTLECNIPYQKPITDSCLEDDIIDIHWQKVNEYGSFEGFEEDKELARNYRNSITKDKLQRLYRWGYRMAQRTVPWSYENRNRCNKFIEFWSEFCEKNSAEDIALHANKVEFYTWREKQEICWEAKFMYGNEVVQKIKQSDNYLSPYFEPDFELETYY